MSKQTAILNLHIEQITEEPTNTTIMNWVKKLGYYQLNKPKEKADDWIIIPVLLFIKSIPQLFIKSIPVNRSFIYEVKRSETK